MTKLEYNQVVQEFLNNGGVIQQIPYAGPRFVEQTFPKRGYVWATGATNARLKDEGIRK